jgi:glycosyltransferase involved in cell wall biosynthesis
MKTSVVIPTHNRRYVLQETLASLEKQDVGASAFEVVVVDDGSTDGTDDMLKSYAGTLSLNPILLEKNRGRAGARNEGIRGASGDLVVFLDSDMRTGEGFVKAHMDAHESRTDKIAVVGSVVTALEMGKSLVHSYQDSRGAAKHPSGSRVPSRYFNTWNASVRREDLIEVGLFDEEYSAYGFEDVDIGYRLEKMGVGLYYEASAAAEHMDRINLVNLIDKKEVAGRSLPYLLEKFPELADEMKIMMFLPPDLSNDSPVVLVSKVMHGFLLNPMLFDLSVWLAPKLRPGRFAYALMDYIVQYSYLRGIRSSNQ